MQPPTVKHPKTFIVNGVKYGIISYVPLTDAQAKKVLTHALRLRKPKKTDRGKIVWIQTIHDERTVGWL